MRKYAVLIAVFFALFLLLASIRVVLEGWHEYSLGTTAIQQNDNANAITHLVRASRWYFPLIGADGKARRQLLQLAASMERSGNKQSALAIYREVRASILGSRSLYTPATDQLRLCEEHIATLMAKGDEHARTRYLAQLRNHIQPNPWWSLLAVLALLAWLVFTAKGLFHSVEPSGRVKTGSLLKTIAGSLVLLGLMLLFLWLS